MSPAINIQSIPTPLMWDMTATSGGWPAQQPYLLDENGNILTDENGNPLTYS